MTSHFLSFLPLSRAVRALVTGIVLALACLTPAFAQLNVSVTEGHRRPMPIAISDFSGPHGSSIANAVRDNLARSGLFQVQNPDSFLQRDMDVNVAPRFADWRVIKTEALVVGRGGVNAGRLRVEFRLWDVYGESQMLGLEFSTTDENWRRIAHKVSDAIYRRLTGEAGYFDSRIVFVAESGSRTNRVKRLAVMDQDGANPSYLTDGTEQVLNPRFNAQGQQIVYSALTDRGIKIWVVDIETGRKEAVAIPGNMAFAPRFTPDGQSIIFSADRDGDVDVFIKSLRTGKLTQLTRNPAIDTSPDMSPNGDRIVFTSDRGGSTQIYAMNADGSGVRRLTFGEGRYSTAVWSPKGDLIAFTRQLGGQFQIGVMAADGSNLKILAEAYLVEGPTWSPNGRVIMFQREGGPGQSPSLWTVDVSGTNLRKSPWSGPGSDPGWSAILP
ncbi:Tol-Pal system beta propeller repeat protein TolB [Aquidulcibacter sp.]|uniref:Tol-Pal system beta propeller repeat protein TolB n=1 Tax=Aquidulcibacter sp. TaxID=2052990 RepID=UPI0025C50C23|nr:Tol-Pal system beta propeller repeat protein TolB [Aquidulcibacter sp.]MCA3693605.1 Tol-Pal system protein TolB [Aquidulcibacter sp.]